VIARDKGGGNTCPQSPDLTDKNPTGGAVRGLVGQDMGGPVCGRPTPTGPCQRRVAREGASCGIDHAGSAGQAGCTAPPEAARGTRHATSDPIPVPTGGSGDDAPTRPRPFPNSKRRALELMGVPPDRADRYPQRFDVTHVIDLHKAGVSPAEAHRWPDRFHHASEIIALRAHGISPDQATRWPERFDGNAIAALAGEGFTPDEAARFHDRFEPDDVVALARSGFDAESANAYPVWLSHRQIVRLSRQGVGGEQARELAPTPVQDDELERRAESSRRR
jgi:hypothetical protein